MPAKKTTTKGAAGGRKRAAKRPAKQERCAAIKDDGTRCKSPSRKVSKYCANHKGWRPRGTAKKKLDSLKKAREMKNVRKRAATTPGGRGAVRNRKAAIKVMGARAQCAAVTGRGTRCQRVPRKGSKYCATHKGFRPKRK